MPIVCARWIPKCRVMGIAHRPDNRLRETICSIPDPRRYDAALAPLGYKCIRVARTLAGYGYGPDSISFWVVAAERPVPADEKSGLHFCFAAPDAAAVDAFHAA